MARGFGGFASWPRAINVAADLSQGVVVTDCKFSSDFRLWVAEEVDAIQWPWRREVLDVMNFTR